MSASRHPLTSTLLTAFRLGLSLLVLGQVSQGQPGPVTAPANVTPDVALRSRLAAVAPVPGIVAQFLQQRTETAVIELQQQELQQQVAQAGGDLKVLANMVSQTQQGNLPKYDPRIRIPQATFQRYIVFRNTLEVTSRSVKLNLTRNGNRLTFGDAPGASILKGLSIDLSSGELFTQDNFSARPIMIQVSSLQDHTGLGASSGVAWNVKGSNPKSFNALQGHLSLLLYTGGQVLLSYQRVALINGAIIEDNINLMFKK